MKIDWRAKLSSRKFWVAIIGLVTSIMMIFGAQDSDISHIAAAITAFGSVASYILGESIVDAGRNFDSSNHNDDRMDDDDKM